MLFNHMQLVEKSGLSAAVIVRALAQYMSLEHIKLGHYRNYDDPNTEDGPIPIIDPYESATPTIEAPGLLFAWNSAGSMWNYEVAIAWALDNGEWFDHRGGLVLNAERLADLVFASVAWCEARKEFETLRWLRVWDDPDFDDSRKTHRSCGQVWRRTQMEPAAWLVGGIERPEDGEVMVLGSLELMDEVTDLREDLAAQRVATVDSRAAGDA